MKWRSALVLLAACGDNAVEPDGPPGPCWPLPATEGGEVQIGTGEVAWEPMGDVLDVIKNASQSDPHLRIHVRMRGMPPGDPFNFLAPGQPKTKANVVIEALGLTLGVECPAAIGYVESPEPGFFDLVYSLRLGFGLRPIDDVDGKQAVVTVELVGSNKRHARDVRTVTLKTPSPLGPMAEQAAR